MKNKRLLLSISMLTVLATFLISCNQTANTKEMMSGTKYYRSLQFGESPWDTEKGIHELTPAEADTINNYKLVYDDQGRLLTVEYCRGDELLTYGSMGGAAKIEYSYEGDKQIKRSYDKEGEQISPQGVFETIFTLNEDGFRKAMKFYDKEGNPTENRNNIHRYEWSRLENGMLKELRYNLKDEETIMNPFCPFYELRFEYDDNGYLTRMSNYQADTLYNCTAENCGDIGVSYFEFENNEKGDLLSFSVHNTVGQLSNLYFGWAKRLNKVDENGYVIEREVFDQDDEYLSGNGIPITQYVYDEHGALTEMRNLDKNKKLINNPNNGVAVAMYKYDNKGNRTGTRNFDLNMVAVTND
jgi:hypothetical protein